VASGQWLARPVVTSLVVAWPVVSGLVVAGSMVTNLEVAGAGLARAGLARAGLASGLVLIFLAVARLVAITFRASRPARATTRGGHVQARRGSSRMRCPPYRWLRVRRELYQYRFNR
jgi:hypothetical protein